MSALKRRLSDRSLVGLNMLEVIVGVYLVLFTPWLVSDYSFEEYFEKLISIFHLGEWLSALITFAIIFAAGLIWFTTIMAVVLLSNWFALDRYDVLNMISGTIFYICNVIFHLGLVIGITSLFFAIFL